MGECALSTLPCLPLPWGTAPSQHPPEFAIPISKPDKSQARMVANSKADQIFYYYQVRLGTGGHIVTVVERHNAEPRYICE